MDKRYWVGFNLVKGVGPVRFRRLLEFFGTAEAAWTASPAALAQAGLDARCIESMAAVRARANLDRHMERLEASGVTQVIPLPMGPRIEATLEAFRREIIPVWRERSMASTRR